ncbi:hypothetical protein AN478_04125 [Thiohalorhabdus denitrificans]|uniref:tRNA threonylcarbamoyladenosine biosynthesis protein TsaB n=1 Tax=Thiohalorhabdus denitrificans TaxID=381306 RepID=A0A0P9EFF0_9GAMM|nr:tRNA (adenosine(37)-N6)-threonylcarbamoyltransferase complex dimerization subunit type 1 TsaB [Thiohalorhabdus denitrificans]KPV41102.1 hypothetical protein AN478_04125 [Thiohalorhabdus denitrificans]SCY38297.1 tRNA threonylcarbamoyladenosine biosynthesis protein TsaB [Thiohalorhabdus denitrificans]
MSAALPELPAPGPLVALAGAADATSVAVLLDGTLHHRYREGVAQHSLHLLPLLDDLLRDLGLGRRDLRAVAFARGPGPFTAGRIVVATAQGLGLNLPLVSVSSLAAAAWASGRERAAVALEAGRGEVYWGLYQRGTRGVDPVGEERVLAPEAAELPAMEGPWWGVGSGWRAHHDVLSRRCGQALAGTDADIPLRADSVAALAIEPWHAGRVLTPAEAVPTYLRASYAEAPSRI